MECVKRFRHEMTGIGESQLQFGKWRSKEVALRADGCLSRACQSQN